MRARSAAGTTRALVGTAIGLLVVAGLTAADVAGSPSSIVIGTLVLAPFIASVLAGPRETALVAVVAVCVGALSGIWNHNFGSADYYLRLVVLAVGGALSIQVARTRERTVRDSDRFALLAAVAEVADGRLTLEQTADRVCQLVVPSFADMCLIDVVHDTGLRRLAARASGPRAAEQEEGLRGRPLPQRNEPGVGAAVRSGNAQLIPVFSEATLQAMAQNEDDLQLLRSLRMRSAVVIPLSARGRTIGALTLLVSEHSGRSYSPEDQAFVEVVAGRVALALDNAGLFTEVQTMEAQLGAALGSLSEAVTIQNPQGNLIYANEAAARLLGYDSPQALIATPADQIMQRFSAFREGGEPLQVGDLPGRRVILGEGSQPLILRVVDRETGEQRWRRTQSSAVLDDRGEVRMVVNVIADVTAAKRAELIRRLLTEAGEALASSEDPHRTLQQLADVCVPELADWCAVSLPDERGLLSSVAVAHTDREKVALARRIGERYPVRLDARTGAPQVFRAQRAECANDITDEMLQGAARDDEHLDALRAVGMRAALLVPMTSGGRSIGVLSLVSAESGRTFSEEDVALAGELARRAATAVENARLYAERTTIARTLQESLLPDPLPPLPGWRTATLYRPAGDENQVGGDFYEAIRLEDAWLLVVGDVTGRGAAAASLTAMMRHTLRTAAELTGSATRALNKLNRDLLARPETSLCTAVCVELREVAGATEAEIICAGHPLPVLVRNGTAQYIGRFGPMLGAYAEDRFEPMRLTLYAGDVLVLYSDGVLDATGRDDRFGPNRLEQTLAGASGARDAVSRIERALNEYQVGAQSDDTAVLAVERVSVLSLPASGHSTSGPAEVHSDGGDLLFERDGAEGRTDGAEAHSDGDGARTMG